MAMPASRPWRFGRLALPQMVGDLQVHDGAAKYWASHRGCRGNELAFVVAGAKQVFQGAAFAFQRFLGPVAFLHFALQRALASASSAVRSRTLSSSSSCALRSCSSACRRLVKSMFTPKMRRLAILRGWE